MYDFGAPETLELHPAMDMPFWVHDSQMEGGGAGFFSSIGKAFKNVYMYSALKKSGVIDKAKDAALKKGRELGGEAINRSRAAKRAEPEAGKRGYDISGLTQKGVERAHSALHDAEGHAEKLLNKAQSKIEKKAGLSGDGLYQAGNGMLMTGNGMFQAVTQPLMTWAPSPSARLSLRNPQGQRIPSLAAGSALGGAAAVNRVNVSQSVLSKALSLLPAKSDCIAPSARGYIRSTASHSTGRSTGTVPWCTSHRRTVCVRAYHSSRRGRCDGGGPSCLGRALHKLTGVTGGGGASRRDLPGGGIPLGGAGVAKRPG
jgi:hypothetical protein